MEKCRICDDTTGDCSCPVYAVEEVKPSIDWIYRLPTMQRTVRIKLMKMWWWIFVHVIKRCPDCKHRLSFGRGYPYCGNCNGN